MFKLHIRWADAAGSWRRQESRWISGSSWIEPYPHPVLAHSSEVVAGGAFRLTVVERSRHEADHMSLTVSTGRIQIQSGDYGTAPIYLVAGRGVVDGSWSLADLAKLIDTGCLNSRAIARTLTRKWRYGFETVFKDGIRVTAGATVVVQANGRRRVTWPEPVERVTTPRRLRSDVDPVIALDRLLRRAKRVMPDNGRAAVELSGGVDSANVALTAVGEGVSTISYGLIAPGPMGEAQSVRRRTIANVLGLRDIPIASSGFEPFVLEGPRGSVLSPHQPDGDSYLEAFAAGHVAASAAHAQIVFTGFGGDEALGPAVHRSPEPAESCTWLGEAALEALQDIDANTSPATAVPLPALLAFQARNPGFLAAGLWPVAPLADPLIVRLGDSLPSAWRRRKRLLRDRLIVAGIPAEIVERCGCESFAPLWRRSMSRHGLPKLNQLLHDGMILVDTGQVNADRLRSALEYASRARHTPTFLFDTLALELAIRSFA